MKQAIWSIIEAYGLPQTRYLLLSRQFKHECDEIALKEGFQLSIDDRPEDSTNIGCPEVLYILTAARSVDFNIYVPCSCLTSGTQSRFPCELAKREFKHHSDRILYCVDKLPQSRALSIRVFRNERETHDTCTESLTPVLEGLAELDHLKTIGIYCGPLLKPAHWDYKDLSEPIFTWDAKTRKWVDVFQEIGTAGTGCESVRGEDGQDTSDQVGEE